ncbi:glycosyltransferase [Thermomonas fusca]
MIAMKVILFVSQLSAGGAEQVAILLSKGLMRAGCEVIIVTARPQGELIERAGDVRVVSLNSGKPIRGLRALAGVIDELSPNAIICFGFTTGIAANLSKLIFGWDAEIIVRNENNLSLEWSLATPLNRLLGPLLSRWVARRSKVVGVSRALSMATERYLNMPPRSACTILNPVLDDCSPTAISRSANLHPWLRDRTTPTFLAVGRLEHQKGFDLLIEAFSRVLKKEKARLIIFGEGSLRKSLQDQINTLQAGDQITLAGFTDSPLEQMHAAHAFVLSSRFEGFGLVLVEALRSGTKVISTNCDFGPAEVLENGRFGVLVPVDDIQAMAYAMVESIRSPWNIERPSESWFNQFTATEAAHQHLKLIRPVCGDDQ